MPELPEVETIRRGLAKRVIGQTVARVLVHHPKSFLGNSADLEGVTIKAVRRQGKLLVFELSTANVLTVHLKMTGQLIWQGEDEAVMGGHPSQSYLDPHPHKHTRVSIDFTDGSHLYFNDLRIFGRMQLLPAAELSEVDFVRRLGPEPLERDFTREYLVERLEKRSRLPIKAFLLDQENIAGLGNIYADESLFRAGILPTRTAGSLSIGEVRNLFDCIQETLELAIQYGGSSERDYLNAIGEKGTYLKIANVYHRTGERCNRCHEGIIMRVKVAGRSTHYCPVCQR